MRLRELRDAFWGQDIYIVGSGPTSNLFPLDFLAGKVCMGLNDAYKLHPAITPIAFMHHQIYANAGDSAKDNFHSYFRNIKYPVAKAYGKHRIEAVDWDNPHFYYFDYSHDIESVWTLTKESDVLYYTPEGCSLQGALQLAWIMGAKNIFLIGCDSRTMGGRHYADYNKNGFRDNEALEDGSARNYDSYVIGTLCVMEFLRSKGVNVLNLSPLTGYHLVDMQFDFMKGTVTRQTLLQHIRKMKKAA